MVRPCSGRVQPILRIQRASMVDHREDGLDLVLGDHIQLAGVHHMDRVNMRVRLAEVRLERGEVIESHFRVALLHERPLLVEELEGRIRESDAVEEMPFVGVGEPAILRLLVPDGFGYLVRDRHDVVKLKEYDISGGCRSRSASAMQRLGPVILSNMHLQPDCQHIMSINPSTARE